MKKLLALALTFCLIFALAACGETTNDSEDAAAADTAKYPAGSTLHLSDNLPDIEFPCDYNDFGDGLEETFAGYEIESAYVPVDEDEAIIAVYRWNNEDGQTLMEAAKADIEYEGITEEYIEPKEMDAWEEKGDYNYVYDVYYTDIDGKAGYIEDYYFNDGDDIVVLEWITYADAVEIADDLVFNKPSTMSQVDISEEAKEDGLVASFTADEYDWLASCDVYYTDKKDSSSDLDDVIDWYEENYTVNDCEKFTYGDSDTPIAWIQIISDYEGNEYYCEEYVIDAGDKFIVIDFYTENDEWVPYMSLTMTAMAYGFSGK